MSKSKHPGKVSASKPPKPLQLGEILGIKVPPMKSGESKRGCTSSLGG
jgi:hypothetical protein